MRALTPFAVRLVLFTEAVLTAEAVHYLLTASQPHSVRLSLFALTMGLAYVGLGLVLQTPSRRWADFNAELMQLVGILAAVWLFGMLETSYFHLVLNLENFGQAMLVSLILNSCLRLAIRFSLRMLRRMGRNARYVLVVAQVEGEEQVRELFARHPELGVRLAGVVRPHDIPSLQAALRERVVDVLLIAASSLDSDVQAVADLGRVYGKDVKVLFQPHDVVAAAIDAQDFYGASLVSMGQRPPAVLSMVAKRGIDLLLGTILLLISLPVLLVAALAIKREDPDAPVLYRQVRIGLNGRRFQLYKLRTMVPEAERLQGQIMSLNEMVGGPVFKIRNDPRVTRPGRWIRRLSVDELPQLWNVLRGEMSLVGPRPPLPHEVERYPDHFRRRLSVRPGITGAWQVAGRNEVQFDAWMEMDLEYIDHWSLGRDLRILAKTIPTVLSGRGAS